MICVATQIAGQEVSLNPWAGVILGSVQSDYHHQDIRQEEAVHCLPLSHSLLSLSRPVYVPTPPAQTLVFVWLLAQGLPRAQVVKRKHLLLLVTIRHV